MFRRVSIFPLGAYLFLSAASYGFLAWLAESWPFPPAAAFVRRRPALPSAGVVRLSGGDRAVLRGQESDEAAEAGAAEEGGESGEGGDEGGEGESEGGEGGEPAGVARAARPARLPRAARPSLFPRPARPAFAPQAGGGPYQRIARRGDDYAVEYGLRNFNNDPLSMRATLPAASVVLSMDEFGFYPKELKAVDAWFEKAQDDAIGSAKARMITGSVSGKSQWEVNVKVAKANRQNAAVKAETERVLADLQQEYKRRKARFYGEKGFRLIGEHEFETDVPAMVRRNWRRLSPAALPLSEAAQERSYGMEELVGAATAMVQTAVRYVEVPLYNRAGKNIGGTLPPPETFVEGAGDCDTKTALLGSILMNWPNIKMVGLAIPDHYLMAVYRVPARGDVFVEYQGLTYVMIEVAGPAWLAPGHVGQYTEAYLNSGKLFGIQPF